jgi:hypothetical protein
MSINSFDDPSWRIREIPGWVIYTWSILSILFLFAHVAIQYVFGTVAATLAMVEDTEASLIRIPLSEEVDAPLPSYSDDEKVPLVQEGIALVKRKPITASLRDTVRHLRARAGWISCFRGFGILILYTFLMEIYFWALKVVFSQTLTMNILAYVLTQVTLGRFVVLWTHMVISEPSEKKFYQRLVPFKVYKKAIIPTTAAALTHIGVFAVPIITGIWIDIGKELNKNGNDIEHLSYSLFALKLLAILAAAGAFFFLVFVPINVSLIRAYAALLPEDETPIVPFDRTFGGHFVPKSEGGSGKLKLVHAWRTFDWNGRVRLIKVWVKTIAMQIGLCTIFFALAFIPYFFL